MYVYIYSYGLNEEACYATQSSIKEKSNKMLANTPGKIFYQRNTKITSL